MKKEEEERTLYFYWLAPSSARSYWIISQKRNDDVSFFFGFSPVGISFPWELIDNWSPVNQNWSTLFFCIINWSTLRLKQHGWELKSRIELKDGSSRKTGIHGGPFRKIRREGTRSYNLHGRRQRRHFVGHQ